MKNSIDDEEYKPTQEAAPESEAALAPARLRSGVGTKRGYESAFGNEFPEVSDDEEEDETLFSSIIDPATDFLGSGENFELTAGVDADMEEENEIAEIFRNIELVELIGTCSDFSEDPDLQQPWTMASNAVEKNWQTPRIFRKQKRTLYVWERLRRNYPMGMSAKVPARTCPHRLCAFLLSLLTRNVHL